MSSNATSETFKVNECKREGKRVYNQLKDPNINGLQNLPN